MKNFYDFAQALQVGAKHIQLYSDSHPKTAEAIDVLTKTVNSLLTGRDRLHIAASRGKLFVDSAPVAPTIQTAALVRLLEERKLSGFVFVDKPTSTDLVALLRVLTTKPQKIDEQGGAAHMISSLGARNLRISNVRYEELREDEEIVPAGTGHSMAEDLLASAGINLDAGAIPLLVQRVLVPLFAANMRTAQSADPQGASRWMAPTLPQSDSNEVNAALEPIEVVAGELNEEQFRESVRKTLMSLDTEQLSALLVGIPTLAPGPFRSAVEQLAPEVVAAAMKKEIEQGKDVDATTKAIAPAFSVFGPRTRDVELLRARLMRVGITDRQLDEMLALLEWENLGRDQRLQRLGEGNFIFEFHRQKIFEFLRELVADGRASDVLHLLDRYARGILAPSPAMRSDVAAGLEQFATLMREPGFPVEAVAAFEKALLMSFIREPEPPIHHRVSSAFEEFLTGCIALDQTDRAYRDIVKVESAITAASEIHPWKMQKLGTALDRLCRDDRIVFLLDRIRALDPDSATQRLDPLLMLLGDRVAGSILDALGAEEDRSNRARFVRALKVIGKPALQHLGKALESNTWYLVRNALNILGDLNAHDLVEEIGRTLSHEDVRVKKAAVRTLSRIGGLRAESMLAESLSSQEAEIQNEILLALGTLRADSVVPSIVEIVRSKRDDRLKERAAEALGMIGSPAAIPVLSELVRRRGFGGESVELRIQAGRALAAIGTAEARQVLQQTIDAEPRGTNRDTFERILGGRA